MFQVNPFIDYVLLGRGSCSLRGSSSELIRSLAMRQGVNNLSNSSGTRVYSTSGSTFYFLPLHPFLCINTTIAHLQDSAQARLLYLIPCIFMNSDMDMDEIMFPSTEYIDVQQQSLVQQNNAWIYNPLCSGNGS